MRACSSVAERYSYKVDVLGSNPSRRTTQKIVRRIQADYIETAMKKFFLNSFIFLNLFFIIFSVSLIITSQKTNVVLAADDKCNNTKALGLDEISTCLDQLAKEKEQSEKATRPIEDQLDGIKNRVIFIEKDLVVKGKNIKNGYEALEKRKDILNRSIRRLYINTSHDSPFAIFLSLKSAFNITQALAYDRAQTNQDKQIITTIVISLSDLEEKKKNLETEQKELVLVKEKLDKVVSEAKAYQATLSTKIAQLSAQQQQLIAQRLGSLNIPRSAGTSARGCSDDRDVNPGFSPRTAFFTYGAPHRNGLNQYGAWGRAKAGQNEETILSEYYPGKTLKKDYDQNIHISTTTGWGGTIEEYVKRIYEVPDSWTDNNLATLKAQAVAARTYALNVTDNGSKSICTSEQCQVFKPDPKGGNWEQAVNATAGWVLMDGGSPAFTQYASTHGGYIQNLGKFDGSGGNPGSFSELNSRAYDKESPWFYCDWGARSQYNNTAWLKPDEVADIVNVILLARADSGTGDHLYQTDKPHPYGGEVWSPDKVKSELKSRGVTPYNNVSSISISADFSSGKTNSVNISGDKGSTSIDGNEFKNWFNLRAPANIQIVGPLYNVETK